MLKIELMELSNSIESAIRVEENDRKIKDNP